MENQPPLKQINSYTWYSGSFIKRSLVMDGQQKHIRIFHWKNNLHFGESPSRGQIYSATYLTMYRHFVTPSVDNGHVSNN